MESKKYMSVDATRCVACGECEKVCPRNAIQVVQGCFAQVNKEICVGCGICEKNCPVGCVLVMDRWEYC